MYENIVLYCRYSLLIFLYDDAAGSYTSTYSTKYTRGIIPLDAIISLLFWSALFVGFCTIK